mgnify:FL=1
MTIVLYMGDDEIELPTRNAVCPHCEGRGTSSAYLGAITQSDREPGWSWDDSDDFDDYMRGAYDRACDHCGGKRVVEVADRDRMTAEQIVAYDEQLADDYDFEAEQAAERRMGA